MGSANFDYSEFEKYADNFKKISSKIVNLDTAVEALQRAGNKSLTTVKKATPTKGGTLKRGWAVEKVKKSSNGASLMLINNIEYAPFVEYGHRQKVGLYVPELGKRLVKPWVNGAFMLTDSMDEIARHLDDEADKLMAQLTSMLEDF
ncbi:hypothetical protein JC2156_04330 [Weissella koreensis KCTC 3621]|uniref:HK97 gp10 family phage protein n=1 Tax=Weissella koreensis TaxID=165096 RepID=UPI00026F364E|nr:HK97 gp10 family phage protein [Weissella koreensis]EJF33723.1 hypothetical protein JC2156_05370 [Weissella koreensis KCTC 3621]EJF34125.1 hypothetical protein JC2156_04330 [Weissella koreensis KCTC 3621]